MSAVLLVAIPLLVAFISIMFKKYSHILLLVTSFSLIVLLGFDLLPLESIEIGGFNAPFGIELVLDDYSNFALIIVNTLFFVVAALNVCNFKKLSSILLVGLAGLNGLLLTGDLFNLFVFLEITGISAYLITSSNKKPMATFNYLVAGTVGSSLYLLGLIILYNMFGTLNMADLSLRIAASGASNMDVAFPFLLMFIGLGVEAKLLPFNSWVKGVLGSSNTLSGPMIAGVYAAASLLVFGRLLTDVFVVSDQLQLIIYLVLGFSIFAGEAMAYSSSKAREILLFSSIAQAGIAVLLFASGFTGYGVLFVTFNGFSKIVLFSIINQSVKQLGTDDVDSLKGLFVDNKVIGISFTVVVLSLLGLPLFAGFVVKIGFLQELFNGGHIVFPIIILLSSVIEGVYFVKLLVKMWFDENSNKKVEFNFASKYTFLVIAVVFVIFGLYRAPLLDFVESLTVMIGGIL